MSLDDLDLRSIIDDLGKRYEEVSSRCTDNRLHLFCDPSKDPVLPGHLGAVTPWQWDGPRQVWQRLKARLIENRAVARCAAAKDTARWRAAAERLESVLNDGYLWVEEREALDVQGSLADGQLVDGLGVLHWVKAAHLWPEPDDYEWGEEGEEGFEEYEGGWRETDARWGERRRGQCAKAGFPFYVEVVPRAQVAFLEDRSLANGLGMVLVTREVGTIEYLDRLQARTTKDIKSIGEGEKGVPVGVERDAPAEERPSRELWGDTLTVHQLWTRREYYEVAVGRGRNWKRMNAFEHGYGMPPFALCSADEFNDAEPLYRFLPALEGMFRIKPALDRIVTLYLALAEQVALPLYYWRSTATGAPLLSEEGKVVTLSRNSMLAHKAPDGYELVKLDHEVNQAFVQGVDLARTMADETKPDVGQAEVSATTDPWAIRLQQAQANVVPARYVTAQKRAIRTMFRNWAEVMGKPAEEGGFGEPVATFRRLVNGKVDRSTTVWVDPEDIASLDVDANIEATSAQERITKVEHGKGLLADGLITRYEFYEKYYGAEDPDEMISAMDAEALVNEMRPVLLRQELAKRYGTRVVLGPNGELIGADGQVVDPRQVLAEKGVAFPGGGPAPGSQMEAQMPELPGLESPSNRVAPLAGMVG